MSDEQHTPTPWEVSGDAGDYIRPAGIRTAPLAMTLDSCTYGPIIYRANAEFIVNACNCHDELVAACEAIDRAPNGVALGDLDRLRAAIAKTKGETT